MHAHWGDEWRDAAAWTGWARIGAAPDGSSVLDAFVKPVLGEAEYGLIVDVREPGASASSRPFYALSGDSARFEEPVQPITFSTPTPPRQLRVYARARRYWLVTHLRRVDGQDRIFWGRIDWDKTPIALEEIDSAQALEEALYVIGLK